MSSTEQRKLAAIMFTERVGCEPPQTPLTPAHGLLLLALADAALVC